MKTDVNLSLVPNKNVFGEVLWQEKSWCWKSFHTINLLLKNTWFATNNAILFNIEHAIFHSKF